MKITLSNIIQIEEPTPDIIKYCKNELTIKNPEYSKKVQMGFWTAGTPKNIMLYNYDGKNIYLPIGCFNDIWDMYPDKSLYTDYSVKVPRKIESSIILRDYQKPCLNALKTYVSGLFILPCGLGKTECALQTAFHLQQHTLFITHTRDLMNQAKDRCEEKMKCSTSTISDGKIDTSGDIVFATVQTLFKNLDEIPQDEFGLVVVDECFPKGTKISTPEGYKNIEDINIGDCIYTYNHELNKLDIEKVDYLFNKDVDNLIKIKHSYGSFVCTPNHPIYTDRGYIRADELLEGDVLYEMQLLSKRNCKRKFYKGTMVEKNNLFSKNWKNLLFYKMFKKKQHRKSKSLCTYRRSYEQNVIQQSFKERGDENEGIPIIEEDWSQTENTRWEWSWFDGTATYFGTSAGACWSKSANRNGYTNKNEKRFWLSNLLQIRYWYRKFKDWYRSGRKFTFITTKKRTRLEKGYISKTTRVESIEIQKSRNNGKSSKSNKRITVYNIGVSKNHNYFANDILVHNCHHLSANADSVAMFRTSIDHFASRYKLGLTATLHRADGLEKCIPKLLGDPLYEIIEDNEDYVGMYQQEEVIRFPKTQFQVPARVITVETGYSLYNRKTNTYRDVFDKNGMTISFSKLLTDLSKDADRNFQIVDLVNNLPGSTIILSDRVEQLKALHIHIPNSVEIDGTTKKKDREQAIEDIKNGNKKVLLASYKLAKEGLDCKILNNIVLATPIKDEAIVIQCVGRVQRTYPGKTEARVYDLVDDVSMLDKFFKKRRAIYRRKGWWKNDK